MKYQVRKGPEYTASSQAFSLQELEQRLQSGEIDNTYQARAIHQSFWQGIDEVTSVTANQALIHAESSGSLLHPYASNANELTVVQYFTIAITFVLMSFISIPVIDLVLAVAKIKQSGDYGIIHIIGGLLIGFTSARSTYKEAIKSNEKKQARLRIKHKGN